MRRLALIGFLWMTACPRNETNDAADAAMMLGSTSTSSAALKPLSEPSATTVTSAPPIATLAFDRAPAAPSTLRALPSLSASAGGIATAAPASLRQLKQCCAALQKQSQQPSAQSVQLAQAAAMCDSVVGAIGSEALPQVEQVKQMMTAQGIALPPVCQGL